MSNKKKDLTIANWWKLHLDYCLGKACGNRPKFSTLQKQYNVSRVPYKAVAELLEMSPSIETAEKNSKEGF